MSTTATEIALVPRNFKPHGNSKLTVEQVADMRCRWVPKPRGACRSRKAGPSITELAGEFGVTYYAAWSAIHRGSHVQVRA